MLGARDCHVEPTLASLCQKGPETVGQVAARVLAVADRQDDGVAFVPLDTLEVLDEEPLFLLLIKELRELRLELRVFTEALEPTLVDPVRVLDPHRDDTEGLVRARSSVPRTFLCRSLFETMPYASPKSSVPKPWLYMAPKPVPAPA